MLINQCFLARQILSEAQIPTGKEEALVTLMLAEMIRRLDEQLPKSRAVFSYRRAIRRGINDLSGIAAVFIGLR
jgi:hypothetical protein